MAPSIAECQLSAYSERRNIQKWWWTTPTTPMSKVLKCWITISNCCWWTIPVGNDTYDRNLSSIVLDQYINNVSKEIPEFHGPALQEWKTPLQLLLSQPRACAPESLHTPRGFVKLWAHEWQWSLISRGHQSIGKTARTSSNTPRMMHMARRCVREEWANHHSEHHSWHK